MKKIYFHVGLPKTGTSYLQSTFAKNVALYKENGLIYPDLSNNHEIAAEGHTTSGNGLELARRLVPSLTIHQSTFDEVSFFKTLDPAYDYLISSEWFISIPPEKLLKLVQLVNKTHEFYLICFYRSIPELINSNYLQGLKVGKVYSDFLDAVATIKKGVRNNLTKLIFFSQLEIKHSFFNYNCCEDLIDVFDSLIFGRKVSYLSSSGAPVNPSPDRHQVNILKLLADLGVSDFGLNMKYIEKSGGKSTAEFLIDNTLAESIELDFKDEIAVLNEISCEGHQYIPFKKLKKSVVKLSPLNLTKEDIIHFKSSIKKSTDNNLKETILWMSQFLGGRSKPSLPDDFDCISYLILNPELILKRVNPVSHYLSFGEKEGRQYKNVVQKKILVIGHSHIAALRKAQSADELFEFHNLHVKKETEVLSKINFDDYHIPRFLHIGGNAHNVFGLVNHPSMFDFYLPEAPELPINPNARLLPVALIASLLKRQMLTAFNELPYLPEPLNKNYYQIESPPPIPSETHIRDNAIRFKIKIEQSGVSSSLFRYKFWRLYSMVVRKHCNKLGISFVEAPKESQDAHGFLLEKYWAQDGTHANELYGDLVLDQIREIHRQSHHAQL